MRGSWHRARSPGLLMREGDLQNGGRDWLPERPSLIRGWNFQLLTLDLQGGEKC